LGATNIPRLPKGRKGIRTKQKLIDQGIVLLSKGGYQALVADDVAKAAGLSVGTFYIYFKDKRDLFLTVLEQINGESEQAAPEIIQALKTKPARFAIKKVIRALISWTLAFHKKYHRIFSDAYYAAPNDPLIQKALLVSDSRLTINMNLAIAHISETLTTKIADSEFFVIKQAAQGVIHALAAQDEDVAEDEVIDALARMIVFIVQKE
jgi:AcrR family transcriptional regulator